MSESSTKVLFTEVDIFEMAGLKVGLLTYSRCDQKSCLEVGQFKPHLEKWMGFGREGLK